MKATTTTLLRHAFDVMDSLKNKQITVEDAKAQGNIIKQANNVLRYELDRAIALQKFEGLTIRDIEDK